MTLMVRLMMPCCVLLLAISWLCGCMQKKRNRDGPDLITIQRPTEHVLRDEEKRGAEILLASAKAYEELKSYQGTTLVKDSWGYDDKGNPNTVKASASVTYSKPNKIRIEGRHTDECAFVIVSEGKDVWCSEDTIKNGVFQKGKSIKYEIETPIGITAHATIVIPSVLLQIEWDRGCLWLPRGRLLPAFATKARYDGEEKVEGLLCHRVVCEREIATWIFWVDAKTRLLRKREEHCSPENLAAQRKYGGGGASGKIKSSVAVETYTVEAVNQPIDEKNFKPIK